MAQKPYWEQNPDDAGSTYVGGGNGRTVKPGAASTAATSGGAEGAGMSNVLAYAGLSSAAGLFGQLLAQQAAREEARRQERFQREMAARARLHDARKGQIDTAGQMGDREQNALQTMLGVLARTAR